MSESNLYQRKGQWYARVKVGGRDIRRSLRTSSVTVARQRLKPILAETAKVRESDGDRHLWKQAYIEWRTNIEGGLKPKVIARYRTSLKMVRPIVDKMYVEDFTTKTIAAVIKHRKAAGATNATIRRDLTAVSSVLSYCCGQGWLEENVAHNYDRSLIRERRDPITLPDEADITAAVKAAYLRFGDLIRFCQYTGMRQNEAVTLTWGQIRGDNADLRKSKTDRARVVPLTERAKGTLGGTKDDKSAHVFSPESSKGPFKNIASRFTALIKSEHEEGRIKRPFKFHDLRHWFAVDYLRSGGKLYDLQKIMGHSSVKTTELYLDHLTPDEQGRTL